MGTERHCFCEAVAHCQRHYFFCIDHFATLPLGNVRPSAAGSDSEAASGDRGR